MAQPVVRRAADIEEPHRVEFDDMQALVRFGHGRLTEACFLLLEVADRAAACAWLLRAPVTSARKTDPPPATALQVAFTAKGLLAVRVAPEIVESFSEEFRSGMTGDEGRSRRLGDVDANAPTTWAWGGNAGSLPDLVVMLYAREGGLEAWEEAIKGPGWERAFRLQRRLATFDMGEIEPFGFADGLSQPRLDWQRLLPPDDKEPAEYANVVAPGEIVLGYRNEYGRYTDRPLIDPAHDPRAMDLPPAEDVPQRRDLGRNGSYLVFRQLHQDVRGFWQFLDRQAGGVTEERWRLAAAMVGRTRTGVPLAPLGRESIPGVGPAHDDIDFNQFTYAADPDGIHCPFGAHVRRANPRTGDMPPGTRGLIARLIRMLGFKRRSFRDDLIASTRFHRLLRRGREYGSHLDPEDALDKGPADEERGLHFICVVANIARQFEFVQNAWITSAKFAGMSDQSDPLLGNRAPLGGTGATNVFAIPQADGPARRITALPQFVRVEGGAYFFLPGLRALRHLAGAPSSAPIVVPEPPVPPIRGQKLLRALHRGLEVGLHAERRLEPFFRRGFNRAFRESLAAFIQYLINRRRPNEGLGLAEERIAPDEEASLQSIIDSFGGYMRRTYQPGRLRAQRQHQDPRHRARPSSCSATTCRSTCAGASSRSRGPSTPTCASPGPGPTCRPTSRTSASSAARSS